MAESPAPRPSPIARLLDYGQSPWYDNLTPQLVASGGLRRLMDEDGIRGLTSNPTIFEKAMAGGEGYDEQLAELARAGMDTGAIYWELVIDDVAAAADTLRPVHDETGGTDGFVSVEVAPDRAHEAEPTIEQALWLHGRLERPNVMVKIPGTAEGIP